MHIKPFLIGTVACAVLATAARAAEEPANAERGDQQIRKLIQQLGDKDYYARQRAEAELSKFGFETFDALSEATASDDLEIAARARHLLRMMKVQWYEPGDPPQVKQLLSNYDLLPHDARLAKINALTMLPSEVGLPALCRIVRYEKSSLVSKEAAIEIMFPNALNRKPAPTPKKETADLVRKHLSESKRVAAEWLRAWSSPGEDPRAVAEEWARRIEAEEKMLRSSPGQSSPEIVAALLRLQIARWKRLGRTDDAVAAIQRLMQLQSGDPETLSNLLEWLVEQKAWKAVDDLAQRFGPQISVNPALLYGVAEAQAAKGDHDRAEKTARQAAQLYPGKTRAELLQHWMIARNLQQRGMFAWAKREYQHVAASQTADTADVALDCQSRLSEMLHDQGEEQDAADALQAMLDAMKKMGHADSELVGRSRARMNYFLACHWQAKGEEAKHREFLDKALAADETDIDVLIAFYRLPDQKPDQQQKIRRLIQKAAADLREQVADQPDDASAYNQLAWLIGNTEGDLDEALRASRKSLELRPEAGGYYDTLARVYFAKGDFANAIHYQTKALEMDPHSRQMQRQLEVFRKKLEEQKGR